MPQRWWVGGGSSSRPPGVHDRPPPCNGLVLESVHANSEVAHSSGNYSRPQSHVPRYRTAVAWLALSPQAEQMPGTEPTPRAPHPQRPAALRVPFGSRPAAPCPQLWGLYTAASAGSGTHVRCHANLLQPLSLQCISMFQQNREHNFGN